MKKSKSLNLNEIMHAHDQLMESYLWAINEISYFSVRSNLSNLIKKFKQKKKLASNHIRL